MERRRAIIPAVKVAIVGSRHYPDMTRVGDFVRALPPSTVIVTGGASGVDAAAERAARDSGIGVIKLPQRMEEALDATAGERRNQRLIDTADVVVAFWDGRSTGTRGTVDRALASGREVHVYLPGTAGLTAR